MVVPPSSLHGGTSSLLHRLAYALLAAQVLGHGLPESCEKDLLVQSVGSSSLLQKLAGPWPRSPWPRSDPPSFAVFTRIIKEELPYVRSFVEHYAGLGVSHFYMLTNKERDLARIRAYMQQSPGHPAAYSLLFRKGGADAILRSPDLLAQVKEDYIVALDIDEYWVLPKGVRSLHGLVEKLPGDIFYADWRVVTHDEEVGAPSAPYGAFALPRGKYMARRSVLRSLHGLHVPKVLPGKHRVQKDGGVLLHFWGRSLADVVAKSASQVFSKCRSAASPGGRPSEWRPKFHSCGEGTGAAAAALEQGNLTQRMKVLALLALHPVTEVVEAHQVLQVDRHEEALLLQEFFGRPLSQSMELLRSVRANYARYKGCLGKRVREQPPAPDLLPSDPERWLRTVDCPGGRS